MALQLTRSYFLGKPIMQPFLMIQNYCQVVSLEKAPARFNLVVYFYVDVILQ